MTIKNSNFEILDCTLRDGSYVNDFQFTSEDTKVIAKAIQDVGFKYIEVGHGIGLGASENTKNVAAATDLEYMEAANEVIDKSMWGMFCIPGIATLDHLEMAGSEGMDFVRVGVNVNEVEKSEEFIKKAKDLNLFVCTNFMKSYALKPKLFAEQVKKSVDFGSDVVYLVDSAGSMLPLEVEDYIQESMKECQDVKLGFHGHDNLGLSVANSLICVEMGVFLVDTSLQGYGRSAGNTVTEQFLSALIRSGYEMDLDPVEVMRTGEKLIRPLVAKKGISSLDTASGQAQFHSSYMPIITSYSKQYKVDPRALIIELCKHDKLDAPEDLVARLAEELSEQYSQSGTLITDNYFGEEQ